MPAREAAALSGDAVLMTMEGWRQCRTRAGMAWKGKLPVLLILAFVTAGCEDTPDLYQPPPMPPSPMHDATVQASKDCGGPYAVWSRVTSLSVFPYGVDVSEWMRCLNDGRVVGPYSYRLDGS